MQTELRNLRNISRSSAAFFLSVKQLFSLEGKGKRRIYFWTFTSRSVRPDEYTFRAWSLLMRDLTDAANAGECASVHGVRVFELHESHGIHIHALMTPRLSVAMVRRLASRYGFGRIQVERADAESARYLSKYLRKRDGHVWPKGCRRWQSFGGLVGVKCRDVEIESPAHERFNAFRVALGGGQLDYMLSTRAWLYARDNWPFDKALAELQLLARCVARARAARRRRSVTLS